VVAGHVPTENLIGVPVGRYTPNSFTIILS